MILLGGGRINSFRYIYVFYLFVTYTFSSIFTCVTAILRFRILTNPTRDRGHNLSSPLTAPDLG